MNGTVEKDDFGDDGVVLENIDQRRQASRVDTRRRDIQITEIREHIYGAA